MSSCFGQRKKNRPEDEEALIAQYDDDTVLQRRVHQKMHSYQMIRALTAGYLPSTEQIAINLRTILASDVLNPENPELSESGRRLLKYTKQWLKDFIELLLHKNSKDEIQDFIWYLSKARLSLDVQSIRKSAAEVRAREDTAAGK